jgi:thiol-disulfide isomerase/thioredoxin
MRHLLCALLIGALAQPSLSKILLSKDTFEQMTAGKSVFILFMAPYCQHSRAIAPAWENLHDEFAGHKQVLVAQVDCTLDKANEDWCSKEMGVLGFPTLLYGEPSSGGVFLKEYSSTDKEYKALSTFAKTTLAKPICSPGNLEPCDNKVKKQMKAFLKMSSADIDQEVASRQKTIDDAEQNFAKEFSNLQTEYDEKSSNHESNVATIKRNLKMLDEVKKHKA